MLCMYVCTFIEHPARINHIQYNILINQRKKENKRSAVTRENNSEKQKYVCLYYFTQFYLIW